MDIEEVYTLLNESCMILGELLSKQVEDYTPVSADEIIKYFDGAVPSGDETTLEDLIKNQWLLLHELMEISFLKRMGLEATIKLFETNIKEIDIAHIKATRIELDFAKNEGDLKWVHERLNDVRNWSKDMNTDVSFRKECKELLELHLPRNTDL